MIPDDNDDVKNLNITERPSSRGGMAFDISFDDKNVSKRIPKGLQKRKKTSNLTKEELQAKLDAAEQRRKVNNLLFVQTIGMFIHHCRLGKKSVKKRSEVNLSMTAR